MSTHARLDIAAVEGAVQQFLDAGLAPSTRRTYAAAWKRYQSFANTFSLPLLPISQEKVTLFVAFLGTEGLSVSTVETYLAALRYFRIRSDPSDTFPSLHTPHMKILLRGIARAGTLRNHSLVRLPITASLMLKIKTSLAALQETHDSTMLWAACCTGFFGFLRCAEFLLPDEGPFDPSLHLSLADIHLVMSPAQWRFDILIKGSKTDQLRVGSTVSLGATGAALCPVAALLDYLNARGNTPGPLFIRQNSTPLRRKWFVTRIQHALSAAGVPGSSFNGHSFRIGAATTASAAAIPETTIKTLGRWRSMAYQRYIRPSAEKLAQLAPQLASQASINDKN